MQNGTLGSPNVLEAYDKQIPDKDSYLQMQSFTKDRPKRKGPIDTLPANVEEWAIYDCPEEIRDAFKQDPTSGALNRDNVAAPVCTIFKILCLRLDSDVLLSIFMFCKRLISLMEWEGTDLPWQMP